MESFCNRDLLVVGLKAVATFSCSVFVGAATYVNLVEVPARASTKLGVDFLVEHFQTTFPRAKAFQGKMAITSFLASAATYLLSPTTLASKYFLAGGLAMISVWPYTLYFIMPTNYKLMDGDVPKKKGEDYVRGLLSKWNKLHAVRSAVGAGALAVLIAGWTLN